MLPGRGWAVTEMCEALKLQFWIRVERCGLGVALVRSRFGALLYEHESVKIVAPEQKYSPLRAVRFVPVLGLCLAPPSIGVVKMVATRSGTLHPRVSLPVSTTRLLTGTRSPYIS